MQVLIACEESQRVCTAFRERGHEAYSCDVIDCSGGHPEWHIKQDVLPLLNGNCEFKTADGKLHRIKGRWDLIIAHPPCTYLSNAGACRLYKRINGKAYIEESRYKKGLKAKEFFMQFYNADCDRIAIENPVPTRIYGLPKYNQIIQPFEYGHPYSKKTCLWLKGLPQLEATNIVTENIVSWVCGVRDSLTRSKTFEGIAKAMAEQWGK